MEASGSVYVALASRASWAKRLLVVAGLVDTLAVVTGLASFRLADRAASGSATFEQFNVAEARHDLVILTQMTVYLVTAVVFIRWFHRAYANLPAIGIDGLGHGVPWAIGAWFVPIVSLVWPKQITNEIWQGSDPLLDAEESRNWRQGKVPVLIGMWWLAFITSSLLVVVGWDLWGDANSYADIKLAAMIEVTGNAIAVLSGVLAYIVVDRASERQQHRAARVAVWRPLLSRPA
jgi:Domain of unknown function (DUF4328)